MRRGSGSAPPIKEGQAGGCLMPWAILFPRIMLWGMCYAVQRPLPRGLTGRREGGSEGPSIRSTQYVANVDAGGCGYGREGEEKGGGVEKDRCLGPGGGDSRWIGV